MSDAIHERCLSSDMDPILSVDGHEAINGRAQWAERLSVGAANANAQQRVRRGVLSACAPEDVAARADEHALKARPHGPYDQVGEGRHAKGAVGAAMR